MKPSLLLFLATLGLTTVSAQNLRSLPPLPAPPAQPETAPDAGRKVVTPALRGIRVLAVNGDPTAPASAGVDLAGLALPGDSSLRAKLEGRLGRPLDFTDIRRIADEIRAACAAAGRHFVQVNVPPQDITNGVLTLVVVEARLGETKVVGARAFSEASYRGALHLAPGQLIDKTQLDADIDWIGRSGYRQATAQFAPGAQLGLTDVTLHVEERRPWSFNLGYTDSGTATTDDERVFAGFTWGNAFDRAQELSYQLTTSPDLKTSVSHSGSYTVPIDRWRQLFRVDGAWSTIHADMAAPFDSKGYSWQVGLNYEIPLRPRKLGAAGALTHSVTAGFDFKETNNNIEFSSMPITDNTTQVVQFRIGYDASLQDAHGATGFQLTGVFSLGGLAGNNDDAAFAGSRSGAKASYAYVNVGVQRQTKLPQGFSHTVSLTGQLTTENLLGSEQLGLGGANSVRGYDEGLVYGDQGILLRNEIMLPAFKLLGRTGKAHWVDSVRLLGFWDYGAVGSRHLLADEDPHLILSSLGVGLRYQFGEHFNLRFDYGWQQKDVGFSTREEHGRGHVNATVTW